MEYFEFGTTAYLTQDFGEDVNTRLVKDFTRD